VQYATYVTDMITGDWGHSFPGSVRGIAIVGPSVGDILRSTLPVSARLIVPVLLIQIVAGIGAGAIAAAYRGRTAEVSLYAAAVAVLGIPVIALAYVLQMGFAWELNWVPTSGLGPWRSYILPVTSLSLTTTALTMLSTRSHLQDVLRQPFIKAASAYGVPRRRVIGLHAMRLAIGPAVTLVAANLGQLITSLIIVETIYGIPGVGSALYTAIFRRDRALLIALLILTTAFVTAANIVADACHMLLDPRTEERT